MKNLALNDFLLFLKIAGSLKNVYFSTITKTQNIIQTGIHV